MGGGEASQRSDDALAPWITDEMKTVDLKDKRLDKRLCEVLSHRELDGKYSFGCGGRAEMEAAYRLFDNGT